MLPVTLTPVLARVAPLPERAISNAASRATPLACMLMAPVV